MSEQVRRASRLVEIERLLRNAPRGLTTRQISERTGYSIRTIQRDLNVLESELGVPLMEGTGRRWRIVAGSSPIGSVRFTLHEARAIYMATRLLLRHADEQDPDAIAALDKLADALPPALSDFVTEAADELRRRPVTPGYSDTMRTLTTAWAESLRVSIRYRSQQSRTPRETIVDTYWLEPSATGAATYLHGWSETHGERRTFKVDRIAAARLLDQHFAPPPDIAELRSQLSQSWGGAVVGDDHFDVVLEFEKEVAERVGETTWHPSQRLTPLDGGRLRFEAQIPSFMEFVPWVRGWGEAVIVVAPYELRTEIAGSMQKAAARYR
jgi:predicted DNA-binding transcriptional regulator YafY